MFCPKCGNGGKRKVAVTVGENGIVLAAHRPRITLGGTRGQDTGVMVHFYPHIARSPYTSSHSGDHPSYFNSRSSNNLMPEVVILLSHDLAVCIAECESYFYPFVDKLLCSKICHWTREHQKKAMDMVL
ncbi:hypothetical protein Nepgr_015902 [Nepenthes gracilis]|uniref:Uncharacterized protein n=1 Tax=Nepenthes gracilis TaxID=150966 RepID=A0AAD3SPD4_NEPGR|nr:hypothetical protein Nepgr_015902 [Nepenthes gracilis]